MPVAAAIAAAAVTALGIGVMPRVAPSAMGFGVFDAWEQGSQGATRARDLMGFVTPDRLSAVLGQRYGLRFATATATESDRVEVSSAPLAGGGRLDVVLFGGLPGSVRGMACEVTQVEAPGAAGLLGQCARVAAGDAGAPVVASWIRTELGAPASGGARWLFEERAWSAVVGATHYALRAIPARRSWVLSMGPDGS